LTAFAPVHAEPCGGLWWEIVTKSLHKIITKAVVQKLSTVSTGFSTEISK
jgi:hypothetical protein